MTDSTARRAHDEWPALRVQDWTATRDTVHMWTQIVGKIRLAAAPMVNHWWQVPLYVTPRGLTTSTITGSPSFDIEFDFLVHQLRIRTSSGAEKAFALRSRSVAEFHSLTIDSLADLGVDAAIRPVPVEVDPAVPFALDHDNATYDPDQAELFWRQLLAAHRVLTEFRSRFIGKVSPVHFFWGGIDLAVTRFSGREAPRHPGGAPNVGDWVMVEGYSHELSSAGFWPGGGDEGAFYSYAYPEPPDYAAQPVPEGASYVASAGQFLLPYEVVRTAPDPDALVLDFLQSTYEAAAVGGHWDRAALEDDPARRARPR
jgi:hypothetical protein